MNLSPRRRDDLLIDQLQAGFPRLLVRKTLHDAVVKGVIADNNQSAAKPEETRCLLQG